MRHRDPGGPTALRFKESLAPFEIGLGEHAHADPRANRLSALTQDQTVVAGLFDAAEIERVVVLGADDEPDHLGVETLAAGKIFHRRYDVARPRYAERR